MGGVVIKEVPCSEYVDAEVIDRDFILYLDGGLKVLTEDLLDYSWFWWLMYLYNVWA